MGCGVWEHWHAGSDMLPAADGSGNDQRRLGLGFTYYTETHSVLGEPPPSLPQRHLSGTMDTSTARPHLQMGTLTQGHTSRWGHLHKGVTFRWGHLDRSTSLDGHIYRGAHLQMGTFTQGHTLRWAYLHRGTPSDGNTYTGAHLEMNPFT